MGAGVTQDPIVLKVKSNMNIVIVTSPVILMECYCEKGVVLCATISFLRALFPPYTLAASTNQSGRDTRSKSAESKKQYEYCN